MKKFNELLEIDDGENTIADIRQTKKETDVIPWIDKYRPKKLDDIIFQDEIVRMLKKTLDDGNMPHLLFYGQPGSGKTSTILAMAMELFGPRKFRERVVELNASDERGINVVRKKIVTFAKTAIGTADPRYPCPPYKIIILDEADAMTTEAQSALRKVVEDHSNITRFCFICNYINEIIEPIKSRCMKFRFKPLDGQSMVNKLKVISTNENINTTDEAINTIIHISNGDMRKAIMLLQNLKYITKNTDTITKDDVYNVACWPRKEVIDEINDICINSDLNIKNIIKLTRSIISNCYPIQNILNEISLMIIHHEKLDDATKAKISIHFAETEKRIMDGSDEYIQLLNMFMFIAKNK